MLVNCDMGESFGKWEIGQDDKIMPFIDMANIACGFHASDPQIMERTVLLALKHKINIGAHPGYPDLLNFGRKQISYTGNEIINIVLYQVGALIAICQHHNTKVSYIKPHGALYNTMMTDDNLYLAIIKAASQLKLPLIIAAGKNNQKYTLMANKFKVKLLFESFCDRAYTNSGRLQDRNIDNAVFKDINTIEKQAKELIFEQSVTTTTEKKITMVADTICVHGDSVLALESVKKIRKYCKSCCKKLNY